MRRGERVSYSNTVLPHAHTPFRDARNTYPWPGPVSLVPATHPSTVPSFQRDGFRVMISLDPCWPHGMEHLQHDQTILSVPNFLPRPTCHASLASWKLLPSKGSTETVSDRLMPHLAEPDSESGFRGSCNAVASTSAGTANRCCRSGSGQRARRYWCLDEWSCRRPPCM